MKKIIALILALVMALSLAACGGDSADTGETTNAIGTPNIPIQSATGSTKPSATELATNPPATEPAHTHSYSSKVTAPTCTEKGYTTYTCSCGDTYTGDETAAKGHSYSQGNCTQCGTSDPNYTEQDTTSQTVYITETGKKYHSTKSCSGLSNAKAIYDSTLSEAENKGLGPCSKCH